MEELHALLRTLRQALKNGAHEEARPLVGELTGLTALALQQQDAAAMAALDAAFSDLAPFVDRYGEGGPGERWRALGEVLDALLGSARPLDQRRLADPSRLSGRMLRRIQRESGVRPGVLAEEFGVALNQISNENLKLERAGLIHRLRRGRQTSLFLTGAGQELMESLSPVRLAPAQTTDPAKIKETFPHLKQGRPPATSRVLDIGGLRAAGP